MISGWIIFVAVMVGQALVGYLIGDTKGRPGLGAFLGLLLGIVGWIIVAVLQPTPEKQAERDRERAQAAVAAVVSGQAGSAASYLPSEIVDVPQEAAVAEALRRDPSLGDTSDPHAIQRLSQVLPSIHQELRLSAQVAAIQAAEQAADQARQEYEARQKYLAATAASRAAEIERAIKRANGI